MAGMMAASLAVAAGSALGGVSRHGIDQLLTRTGASSLLTSTIIANLAGCVLIGLVAALSGPGGRVPLSPNSRHFLTAGYCGGLTTFSMLGMETVAMVTNGAPLAAAGYVTLNVGGAILACAVGLRWGARRDPCDRHRNPECRR